MKAVSRDEGRGALSVMTGYNNTFGEMNRWKKNKISHRGLAFTKLIKSCFNESRKN